MNRRLSAAVAAYRDAWTDPWFRTAVSAVITGAIMVATLGHFCTPLPFLLVLRQPYPPRTRAQRWWWHVRLAAARQTPEYRAARLGPDYNLRDPR